MIYELVVWVNGLVENYAGQVNNGRQPLLTCLTPETRHKDKQCKQAHTTPSKSQMSY